MFAKSVFDGEGFKLVVIRRGGPMGVDVANLFGLYVCVLKSSLHHTPGARTRFIRHSQMKSISGDAVARYFGIDTRTSSLCRLEVLQDHNSGALANNKTVPVSFERPRRVLRVIIIRGQGPHRRKTSHTHRRDRRLGASTDHQVGISALNYFEAVANCVSTGGAGGSSSRIGPFGSEAN